MRNLELTLTGFRGIRDGMKLDTITLDFSSMPEGLIAIVGPNGHGKTTILDNMHPYRIMPSRASVDRAIPSIAAFSYYDNLSAPQAMKDLKWEHNGMVYRSTLNFPNSGKTKKTECYLFVAAVAGGWVPVRRWAMTASLRCPLTTSGPASLA